MHAGNLMQHIMNSPCMLAIRAIKPLHGVHCICFKQAPALAWGQAITGGKQEPSAHRDRAPRWAKVAVKLLSMLTKP